MCLREQWRRCLVLRERPRKQRCVFVDTVGVIKPGWVRPPNRNVIISEPPLGIGTIEHSAAQAKTHAGCGSILKTGKSCKPHGPSLSHQRD